MCTDCDPTTAFHWSQRSKSVPNPPPSAWSPDACSLGQRPGGEALTECGQKAALTHLGANTLLPQRLQRYTTTWTHCQGTHGGSGPDALISLASR